MNATFSITGMADADAKLRTLVNRLQEKVLKQACVDAAQVVLDSALQLVPVKTGALASSLRIGALKRKGAVGAKVVAGAGFFSGKTFYGGFQEFGWRVGKRPARGGSKLLRFLLRQQAQAGDTRQKVEGKHFMKRAAEMNRQRVVEVFREAIVSRLDAVEQGRLGGMRGIKGGGV